MQVIRVFCGKTLQHSYKLYNNLEVKEKLFTAVSHHSFFEVKTLEYSPDYQTNNDVMIYDVILL